VQVLYSATTHAEVTFEWATIGNPGNAPDTRYDAIGFGSVGSVYQIGKYEVTARQYTEFLNAVADADPNGLYLIGMTDPMQPGVKIQRTGFSPNYSYSVAADLADQPVNYVSFWDAARFANWLHNGQPTGPQGPGTTEDGAYINVGDQTTFARQPGARFFIPTEDEWYKAAYHDKSTGLAATYFDYPTGTNAAPGNDITESKNPGNNANYNWALFPHIHTVAGEFELSDSPYGTFDQGGNVVEWVETKVGSPSPGLRGGGNPLFTLHASWRSELYPNKDFAIGFRVARSIPEPSTALLALMAAAGLLLQGRPHRVTLQGKE
jgi:formylglycine-generating enzyme required for sulfatase activity